MKLGVMVEGEAHPYQALDSSAMPVRTPSAADTARWPRKLTSAGPTLIGWYEGFSLLAAIEPTGVITRFCFGSASTATSLCRDLLRGEAAPNPRLISVGSSFSEPTSQTKASRSREPPTLAGMLRAEVIHPPKRNSRKPWSKPLRRVSPPSVRSWRQSTTSSSTPSALRSVPTRSRLRAHCAVRCTTFYLSITSLAPLKFADLMDGELTIHTNV